MRKLLLTLFTLIVIGVLAGCSIPIGDGELTISSSGIDFHTSDTDTAEDDGDTLVNTPDADEDTTLEDETDVADTGVENEENQTEANNVGQESAGGSEICNDPQDHSSLLNNIGEPFYFPECAAITSTSLSTSVTDADLVIPNSNWEDVAAEYREELSGFEVTENTDFQNMRVSFSFKLDEEYWGTTKVNISQDENDVRLKVLVYNE